VAIIVAGYRISIGALSSDFLSIGAVVMIVTTLITALLARFIQNKNIASNGN